MYYEILELQRKKEKNSHKNCTNTHFLCKSYMLNPLI